MDLRTRAILTVPLDGSEKDQAFEESINRLFVVRNCATCYYSKWSVDKTSVVCERVNQDAPAWAIAMGCQAFDYLPF